MLRILDLTGVSYTSFDNQIICVLNLPCGGSTYQSVPATLTSQSVCSSISSCSSGTYIAAAPTATSDRRCVTCPQGISPSPEFDRIGQYQNGTNQVSCIAWSNCSAGFEVGVQGTATSDVVCLALSASASSSSSSIIPIAVGAAVGGFCCLLILILLLCYLSRRKKKNKKPSLDSTRGMPRTQAIYVQVLKLSIPRCLFPLKSWNWSI